MNNEIILGAKGVRECGGGYKQHQPTVSVIVTTYNHQSYIEECLNGILRQKTNFPFEIILGEDASADGTREICIRYAKKYPDVIRLFLHDRSNVIKIGGKPTGRYNLLYGFSKAQGKYIALCEGDDFWTDESKLQKQVDFMEKHSDYALVFHPVKVFYENSEYPIKNYPALSSKASDFTVKELLHQNFIQTNSVMYRAQNYDNLVVDVMPGDWYLHLYHAKYGRIGFIKKVMSAYRRHDKGLWWGAINKGSDFWSSYASPILNLHAEMYRMFGADEYLPYIDSSLTGVIDNIASIESVNGSPILNDIRISYPDLMNRYMYRKLHDITSLSKEGAHLRAQIGELEKVITLKDNHIANLEEQLKLFKDSRYWKTKSAISATFRRDA